jgi:hypothetical protein
LFGQVSSSAELAADQTGQNRRDQGSDLIQSVI